MWKGRRRGFAQPLAVGGIYTDSDDQERYAPVRSIFPPSNSQRGSKQRGPPLDRAKEEESESISKEPLIFAPSPPRLGDSREEEPLYAYNGGEGEGGRAPRGRSPPPCARRRALVRSVLAVLRESPPAWGEGEAGARPLARERQQSAELRREGREGGTAAEFVECLLFSLPLPPSLPGL